VRDFNYDNFKRLEPLSEDQLIRYWSGTDHSPLISVLCITYNHSRYLEDALRGLLTQRTQFPFEIVLHDDASTDGTQDIIRRYADRYPRIIKPVLQAENQFSKGRSIYKLAARYASAPVLAICEGDDFWIDDNKLQVQYRLMRDNPGSSLLVHPCIDYNERRRRQAQVAYEQGGQILRFDAQDVLNVPGQFAPTASYMIRREVFDHYPSWLEQAPIGDFFLEMYSLTIGKGLYLPRVMSAYRSYSVGSWSDLRRDGRGDHLIDYGRRMDQCLWQMQKEEAFQKLNFDVKRSAVHLDQAIGHLLNKEFASFRREIANSYALYPNFSLIQGVFQQLKWAPGMALLLFKAKRQLNLLLGTA